MKKLIILLGIVFGLSLGEPALVDNYYQIETKEDLEWFRDKVNASGKTVLNAILLADIDYENGLWVPIAAGTGSNVFTGTFDGNNHTISNYYIDSEELKTINKSYQQNIGFVGVLGGTVKNLTLENITVTNHAVGGTVPNATGDKEAKAICVGTIAGWMNADGKIDGATVTGTMNGFGDGQNVGGIAGNIWGKILNSSSAVTINVKNISFVGGIVGMTKKNITIDGVLWKGNINVIEENSTTYIGGIIGDVYEGSVTVTNSTFISDNVTNSVGKTCAKCSINADKLDYGVYSILFKDNKKTLVLNGDYTKTMSETVFDKEIKVDNFVFNRTFKPGVFSTLSLPITLQKENVIGLTFYEFRDVYKNEEGKWEVHIGSVKETNINAGVPYIVIANQENVEFTANSYTFEPVIAQSLSNSTGTWSLNTVHHYTLGSDFGEDRKNVYGFAGKSVDGFNAGQFVHAGERASFKPFRVYLHKETQQSLMKSRAYPLQLNDTIDYNISIIIDTVETDTLEVEPNILLPKEVVIDSFAVEPQIEPIDYDEETTVLMIGNSVKISKHNNVKFYNLLGRRVNKN